MAYWNQKKPKDEEPKSAVRRAMRQNATENRDFLMDIASRIPFSKYRDIAKMQTFEATLYLVLSDLFEEVPEADRETVCSGFSLESLRLSELYATLKFEVERVAKALEEESDLAGSDWVKRVGKEARKTLVRSARYGKGNRKNEAAKEILERELPKISRNQGSATVVFFGEKDAALIEKAMRVIDVTPKALPPGDDGA